MSVAFKELEPYLHYYACRFESKRFEHWELVNEAWIATHALEIPQFISAGVRWAMMRYIRLERMRRHRGNPDARIESIDDGPLEDALRLETLAAAPDLTLSQEENAEYVGWLMNNSNLNLSEKLLLHQRFFQGLNLREIGRIHACTAENIRLRLRHILAKLAIRARQAG